MAKHKSPVDQPEKVELPVKLSFTVAWPSRSRYGIEPRVFGFV